MSFGSDGANDNAQIPRRVNFDCDLDHVQSMISSQLAKLSSGQVDKAYCDIHGTSADMEETPHLLASSLQQLEEHIAAIPNKEAYDLAKSIDPHYVERSQLPLQFLRGTGFRAKPAAEKMVRFFEIKREFFGRKKFVKDIHQSDLDQRDIAYLYSGHVQWVPLKDNSGRLVTVMYPGPKERGVSLQSMLRVAIYLRMVAIEDVQIQRKGFVFVLSAADIGRGLDLDLPKVKRYVKRFIEIHMAMPGSLKAVHIICPENRRSFNEYIFAMLCQFVLLALTPLEAARVSLQKDCSQMEIQDYLKRFGIPPDMIPSSSDDTTAYAALLTQRKALESLRKTDRSLMNENHLESVCMPGPFDVISGRGRSLMSHQGNRILRNLVEEHLVAYKEASRQDKKVVSSQVVDLIKRKGRFLKEHLHGWVEIDQVAARLKVSHAFRDLRASSKRSSSENPGKQDEEMDMSGPGDDTNFFDFDGNDHQGIFTNNENDDNYLISYGL